MKIDFSMLREPYQALFTTGRTYAAFDRDSIIPLIDGLKEYELIADPMAGFGSLMTWCAQRGISTYNVEYNPPTYLWGILNNPKFSDSIGLVVNELISNKFKFPLKNKRFVISNSWYSPESYEIIVDLYSNIYRTASKYFNSNAEEISLAILIPFVGRLSCYVPGNIVANVKRGGICLLDGLPQDFQTYLCSLENRTNIINPTFINKEHEFVFGDLRKTKIPRKLSAFITSPPYPNSRDYYKMFGPENDCILYLKEKGFIEDYTVEEQLISCVSVSKYVNKNVDYSSDIVSNSARDFIRYIENYNGTKQAKYDNKVYYVPYYTSYFFHIEQAYRNFSKYLTDRCDGFIIVTNNTARNRTIPVAESIMEFFQSLDFNAEIVDKYTRELSHVGSINPRVKGFKAKHTEYTIKVSRR